MRYLRNLGRRKVRTALTILGITIGIWALVVFGSMANKITALVDGGTKYYAGKIIVSDATGSTGGFSGAPLPISTVDKLHDVEGVDVTTPTVMLLMDDQAPTMSMGIPPIIGGQVPGATFGRETFEMNYASGRPLHATDEGSFVTVLGSDIARKYDKKVGDTITLRKTDFKVVGILEPTLTAPDSEALVPLEAAQELYVKTLPSMVQEKMVTSDVATSIVVYLTPGADPATVAARIKNQVPNVSTMTQADFSQQIGSATSILNAILVGIALISLVVGGLSVVNTMAMAIAERTREIGIKRAIGGSRRRIVRELVTESAVMGLIGGSLGLIFGAIVVTVGNEMGRSSGTVLFDLTLGTAATAIAFATILGALAGFVPALNAARLDPISALRYE
jgi:putative ABC transport system permease protein